MFSSVKFLSVGDFPVLTGVADESRPVISPATRDEKRPQISTQIAANIDALTH
jgi:hypothetical protein